MSEALQPKDRLLFSEWIRFGRTTGKGTRIRLSDAGICGLYEYHRRSSWSAFILRSFVYRPRGRIRRGFGHREFAVGGATNWYRSRCRGKSARHCLLHAHLSRDMEPEPGI